jgi:ubiquinone/menaquinone biosynthesis C-methylase UbiE
MIWVAAVTVLCVVLLALVLGRPMRIPHEPDREGYQDAKASGAYDQVSCWPIYAFERHIMTGALARERPSGTLLDIGCGPGHLTAALSRKFPDAASVGLDVNGHMLALARRRFRAVPGLGFVRGDAERLPFADSSIDTIVSSLSLHHWKDAAAALKEIGRVLTPGGSLVLFDLRRDCPKWVYFVFVVGQAVFLPAAIRRTNGAVGSIWASWTAAELGEMLNDAGFRTPRVESRFSWLLVRCGKPPAGPSSSGRFTGSGGDDMMDSRG